MKFSRRWFWGLGLLVASVATAGEFSQDLSATDFAAAGLNKLSREEISRLDQLVRARAEHGSARAEAGAGVDRKSGPAAPVHRRMTTAEEPPVQSQISGRFHGYQPGTLLTLDNGETWRVTDGSYWLPPSQADKPRRVRVVPGVLGSYFLEIEGAGRPRAKLVSAR